MTPNELKELARKATPGRRKFIVVKRGEEYSPFLLLVAAVAPGHQVRSDHKGGAFPSADGELIAALSSERVVALAELWAAAIPVLSRMKNWHSEEECDCPPEGHHCGKNASLREIAALDAALSKLSEEA